MAPITRIPAAAATSAMLVLLFGFDSAGLAAAPVAAPVVAAAGAAVGGVAVGVRGASETPLGSVAGVADTGPDGIPTEPVPGPRIESDPVGSGRGGVAMISVGAVEPYTVDPYTVASGSPARHRANAS